MSLLLSQLSGLKTATVTFAGVGVLSATVTARRSASATFAGVGALAVSTIRVRNAAGQLIGAGLLAVTAGARRGASGAFTGAGAFTAQATVVSPETTPAGAGGRPRRKRQYRAVVETRPNGEQRVVLYAVPELGTTVPRMGTAPLAPTRVEPSEDQIRAAISALIALEII